MGGGNMNESKYLKKYFPQIDYSNDDLDSHSIYRAVCPCGKGEILYCSASYSHPARYESWQQDYYVINCENCSKNYKLEEGPNSEISWHDFKVNSGNYGHTTVYLRSKANYDTFFKLDFKLI